MPPADVPALGAALARLVADPALRRTMGAAAAAFVRPRFGVDGYVAAVTGLYDRLLARRGPRVKLGIVYHMPFWRAADGTLREVEGSFARYVDSLAPYFDEISLCVPVLADARGEGHADSRDERHAGRAAALRRSGAVLSEAAVVLPRLWRWVARDRRAALPHAQPGRDLRLRVRAAAMGRPAFVLVVGDLAGAAADDAVSRREAGAVARLHGVRRMERAVDDRPLAGVCQRRGAGGEALARRPSGDRDDDHDDQRARHRDPDGHLHRPRRFGC